MQKFYVTNKRKCAILPQYACYCVKLLLMLLFNSINVFSLYMIKYTLVGVGSQYLELFNHTHLVKHCKLSFELWNSIFIWLIYSVDTLMDFKSNVTWSLSVERWFSCQGYLK